jgi:hypothetical protein
MGRQRLTISETSTELPSDLLIFSPLMVTHALCAQYAAKSSPNPLACAISFSWCGKIRSTPPPWMSKALPRYLCAIAEHSRCQPGRPRPHGVSQLGSPGLAAFHMAKSRGSRLPVSPSPLGWRSPSRSWLERRRYSGYERTSK